MYQNGPEPFIHPVTGSRIGPYEFYEGAAHIEQENVKKEQPKKRRTTQKGEE